MYPPVHFLSMWLNGIMSITNSNDDSVSPWNIPLWISTSTNLCSLAINSCLQFFVVSSIYFITSSDISYIWESLLFSFAGPSYAFFFLVNPRHDWIFSSRFALIYICIYNWIYLYFPKMKINIFISIPLIKVFYMLSILPLGNVIQASFNKYSEILP